MLNILWGPLAPPGLFFSKTFGIFTGFSLLGTQRHSPARGVPSPTFLLEGEQVARGWSHGVSFVPIDPEDVGCSPPLHHVSSNRFQLVPLSLWPNNWGVKS